jgi:hypothetical protein
MVYHEYGLKLSATQVRNLAKGETVRIQARNHGGDKMVHLTKTQLSKLQKALIQSKGIDLHLSNAQLRYHRKLGKDGGSIFSSIGNFFKGAYNKVLKPVYEKALKPAAKWVADHPDQALDYGRKAVKLITGVGRKRNGNGVYAPGTRR